jgi:hypothetical protein
VKTNEELSIDDFYLSKNLKRAVGDVLTAKGAIDDCLYRAKKAKHPSQFVIHGLLLDMETIQRTLIATLSEVHEDDLA